MGDLIEASPTAIDSATIYYHVSASALAFGVQRLERPAEILFLSDLKFEDRVHFMLTLGENCRVELINSLRPTFATGNAPEFKRNTHGEFWVTWNNGHIRVGRSGEATPFMYKKVTESIKDIKYVRPLDGSAKWSFQLGPMAPKSMSHEISGGEPRWVEVGDSLPLGAVIGGHENEPIHIIRSTHRSSLTPGKFVPSEGIGYIPWGGAAHPKENFEALVGYNLKWVKTCKNRIPINAIPGGRSENVTREVLYVGRAEIDGHMIVGKVQPSHNVLYVPYKGKEIARTVYEILVKPVYGPIEDSRKIILTKAGTHSEVNLEYE